MRRVRGKRGMGDKEEKIGWEEKRERERVKRRFKGVHGGTINHYIYKYMYSTHISK